MLSGSEVITGTVAHVDGAKVFVRWQRKLAASSTARTFDPDTQVRMVVADKGTHDVAPGSSVRVELRDDEARIVDLEPPPMKVVCFTLTDPNYGKAGSRRERTIRHFAERGVDAQFFYGIHAERIGLCTIHPFEVDQPGSAFNMGPMPVGCWLTHRAAWAAALLLPDEEFFFLEDDARFPLDWRARFDAARANLPDDWDVLFVGSCCAEDKNPRHVAGEVFEVRWPMATHAYLVRRKALPTMIESQDAATCYAPIDISTIFHTWPRLRVYTILPRVVDQFDTELPP